MRLISSLLTVCLMIGISGASEKPPTNSSVVISPGVTIPVTLKHKLDAGKAKAGDIIKMELVESIAGTGSSVIPSGAKVYGRVVGATRLDAGGESRVAVLIDRMEWKHVVVPVRAVVTGFGALRVVMQDGQERICAEVENSTNVRAAIPQSDGTSTRRSRSGAMATVLSDSLKSCGSRDNLTTRSSLSKTKDVSIRRLKAHPEVSVFISSKQDIVLKSGTLMMLRSLEEVQSSSLIMKSPE